MEWSFDTCYDMVEPWKDFKWSELDTEDKYCMIPCVQYLE